MELIRGSASDRRFEGFVAEASDTLYRTGFLMTGDAGDAEDLVQETFLRIARRWNQVQSMDHPVAYARRILINLVLHDADRRSRQKAELTLPDAGLEAADRDTARVLRGIDDIAEFRWALAQLPARQRAVLVLRYWDDLPVAEVAGILGCSAGTVKSTASRAAARLVGSFCSSDPAPAGFSQAVSIPMQRGQGTTVTINPAAIPAGTELSLGIFQLANSLETSAALITADSYTCTSTAPTTLPAGGALLHWPK